MKVSVDLRLCVGHARCRALAPEVYDTDEVEGKAIVLLPDPPAELHAAALRGARSCPERAITVIDEATGTQLWPKVQPR